MKFAEAIESALFQAMSDDPRIIMFGEDTQAYRMNLFACFGQDRILAAPISEGAFMGAAVTAAMGGLHPVVDLTLVDFIAVAADALLNHAAKVETFSGGRWKAPMVVRAACGGGYGDGGQHMQSLWGWLAHIPGLAVVVPSNPVDAGGLMLSALEFEGPVIYLEHKMLAENWLDWMGGSAREGVTFDVPAHGAEGPVPARWEPLPAGQGILRRQGVDLTMVTVGLSVHRCLEAAEELARQGIEATVVDLRWISPLDADLVRGAVAENGRLLVVDEDYQEFGLSGEIAALCLEAGLRPAFARVCTTDTIPYNRQLEYRTLPNVPRIVEAAQRLMNS